jgi:hypothetical protein
MNLGYHLDVVCHTLQSEPVTADLAFWLGWTENGTAFCQAVHGQDM